MAPKGRGRSRLPAPLPADMVLRDTEGNAWRLGRQLGQGGFGLIYLASPQTHVPVEDDAVHVIKVEYLENGPLFSEVKFYQRAAKQVHIRKWMHLKKIKCLGIPVYWGSGLAEYKGKSYRFMVMERLGQDLQSIFEGSGSRFEKTTVLQLGARMLDALEYIHENEYVHCDIKAANLLLGYTNPHEVYLADYGLSYRYCPNGNHKQYQENPRKGHNGTIEFTSLDAHKGVAPSRRGDLEILGYCMLQWACGRLPWEQNLKDPVAVQTAKTKLLDELPHSVMEWESSGSKCSEIAEFLACVSGLAYDEKPKYEVLKQILLDGLESSGTCYDGPLEFSTAGCAPYHRASKMPQVRSPKAALKPVQPKQKRMQGEECSSQSKPCAGATAARRHHAEEKPLQSVTLHQAEPLHVPAPKPSLQAAEWKLSEMQVDDAELPRRPRAPVTRRKLQAPGKPPEWNDGTKQPEGQQRYPGRELHPQAVCWEDNRVAAAEVAPLQENLSGIAGSCKATRSGFRFTGEIYCYSVTIVVLLLLISLSLCFL